MSSSSIWVMDEKFYGERIAGFNNSWLFSPTVCDEIYHKYLPKERFDSRGRECCFITQLFCDRTLFNRLNELINETENQVDRICWEIANQQIFFTRDKMFVAKCIEEFSNERDIKTLKERAKEIADCIRCIDEVKHPYFIFKNTSCDDNVEWWFSGYDEDDEYEERSLKSVNKYVTEFVQIENNKILKFVSNLDFFDRSVSKAIEEEAE